MKVFTVKSVDVLDEHMQTEIHYAFGMEHHTDYVFQPRAAQRYSATIVMEDTSEVIRNVLSGSTSFPDHEFIVDDLDMEGNNIDRFRIRNGKVVRKLNRGWDWEEISWES
jgi:hypothetical protein